MAHGRRFRRELAPKIADLIYRSMLENFTHLELHSQNIDVLIRSDGTIREVKVKDLLEYLGQLGDSFIEHVRDELIERVRASADYAKIKGYPTSAHVFGPDPGDPYLAISNIRDVLIKSRIESGFRANDEARQHLMHGRGKLSLSQGSRKWPSFEGLEFGFIGAVPVAIKRTPTGQVESYYFRFD